MNCDVAIIGGGCAGLTAALSLPQHLKVAVFCKRPLGNAASGMAQGGIASVSDSADGDHFELHIADTLRAGAGQCDRQVVAQVVEQAPQVIDWLHRIGVPFNQRDKNDDGEGGDANYALGLEGGHQKRRIVHVRDQTGWAVLSALIAQVQARSNITLFERHIAVNLHVRDGACCGVYFLDQHAQQVIAITTARVVLATGGAGRVYLYASTPPDSSGDGIAMAYRAGCTISNMEFFQFHPTCLYHPAQPTLLISEAVRGEGGRLVNADGQAFTGDVAEGDLAARDIIARAIDKEMKRSGADCVFLDCRAHPHAFWQQRFPSIVQECERRGIRIPTDRIPVVPSAHYTGGGVRAALDGTTDVRGVYAIGETACTGLHGANRLASNSLLECLVMGRRCAARIGEEPLEPPPHACPAWDERRVRAPQETVMLAHNWDELRRTMWNYVGILRNDDRLQRARRRIEWMRGEVEEYYQQYAVSRDFIELRNLIQCALLIIEGALARRESRGLHYNIDCPQTAAIATNSEMSRRDFTRRAQAINPHCPFSQRLVVASATMDYRGHVVGFCNPHCRDTFAAAYAQGFAANGERDGESAPIHAARLFFDSLIASHHTG